MSALLPSVPADLRRTPELPTPVLPAPLSFRKEAPDLPLSPLEHQILSICLNAPEDPRDVGILPALLATEVRPAP